MLSFNLYSYLNINKGGFTNILFILQEKQSQMGGKSGKSYKKYLQYNMNNLK
jgi:hypothetical protein